MLSDGDIDHIVARVTQRIDPLVVGVFGSYGVGAAGPASDLDLVVIADLPHGPAAGRRRVLGALRGIFHPVDSHVFAPEAFEAEALEPYSFAWVIVRQIQIRHAAPQAPARLPGLFALAQAKTPPLGAPSGLAGA